MTRLASHSYQSLMQRTNLHKRFSSGLPRRTQSSIKKTSVLVRQSVGSSPDLYQVDAVEPATRTRFVSVLPVSLETRLQDDKILGLTCRF